MRLRQRNAREVRRDGRIAIVLVVALAARLASLPLTPIAADDPPTLSDVAAGTHAEGLAAYERGDWTTATSIWTTLLQRPSEDLPRDEVEFLLGEALMQLGRFDEATLHFRSLVDRSPEFPRRSFAEFRIGEGALLAGQADTARAAFTGFLDRYPEDALTSYVRGYLGDIALARNDWNEARTQFTSGLTADPFGPNSERCRFGLARAFEGLGDDDQAARFYTMVADGTSGERIDDALLNLAILEFRRGDDSRAARTLERLVDPADAHPLAGRGIYLRGRIAQRRGDADEALRLFAEGVARAEQTDPEGCPALRYEWGVALAEANDLERARTQWLRLLDEAPGTEHAIAARRRLVERAFDASDFDQVIELTRPDLSLDPTLADDESTTPFAEYRARGLLARERPDDAATLFEAMLSANVPASDARRGAWSLLAATARTRAGEPDRALQHLASADIDRLADSLRSAALLATIAAARHPAATLDDKDDRLIAAAESFLERFPEGIETADVRGELCEALVRRQRYDDAFTAWSDYASAHPDHAGLYPTLHRMTERALETGTTTASLRWLERLTERIAEPSQRRRLLVLRATAATKANDDATAERLLRDAIGDADDGDATWETAILTLARHLAARGDSAGAAALYERLESQGNDDRRRAAISARAADALASHDPAALTAADQALRQIASAPSGALRDLALYQSAWIAQARGDENALRGSFEELVRRFPESEYRADAIYRLADEALRRGETEGAERWIATLRAEYPESPLLEPAGLLELQSMALRRAWSELAQAADTYRTAYPDTVGSDRAEYWSAEAAFRTDDRATARASFERLAERGAGADEGWGAMIPLRLAQLASRDERWDDAQKSALAARAADPQGRRAHEIDYLLGRVAAARAEFTVARQHYENVVRSTAGQGTETAAMAQWMIGESWFHQERWSEAIDAYRSVDPFVAHPRWRASAVLQIGKCHERQGETRSAAAAYARLLREFPASEAAAEASSRLAALGSSQPPLADRAASESAARGTSGIEPSRRD
ncbi:MAG TPA: tetratricopeptide repeat protein [Pirellulaceae bacterium]|nr:tetratricopeptide repeat protein [Pirellulaceae bacterium]